MQTREITKLIGLCNNAKQLIIRPKKVNITLPLTLATKPSGMGVTVERMAETTTPYATRIIEATHTPRVPFLSQTSKNPYNIIEKPLEKISPISEEEFATYLNRRLEDFDSPFYSGLEIRKLLELFRTHDQRYVQYLTHQKKNFVQNKLAPRFNVKSIEKLLGYIKKDEEFTLDLIKQVDKNGCPKLKFYDIEKIMGCYDNNPAITRFLSQHKLSSSEIEQLIQFQKSNPKHFDEICESGLFDLIQSEQIDSTILKNLRENMTLTPNILKDIKKIHTGKPLVTEIPAGTGLENLGKFVEEGEVGILNGKLYANQGGKPVGLNLSKEKFEELFPLMERFRMEQGFLGDCWLISAIDNIMSNATQRVNLYKLLSQEGNDILIRYPNGKNALRFVNGEISSSENFMECGAKGLKMFEQSFVFHRANKYTKGAESTDVLARLKGNPNLVYKLDGGVEGFFTDAVMGYDNVKSLKIWKDFFITQIYRPIKFRLKTLGQDHSTHAKLSRWKQEKSSNIVIYSCEKGEMNGYREGLVNWDFDLHAPHAYAVKDYAVAERLVTISNPHHTEVNINAPLNILEDYGTIVRFNSV
ncbi:MAG: hypothetical protein NC390_00080 [Fusobacterium sp.]|nr:hypothetical protein [Fusobacterium sp.]